MLFWLKYIENLSWHRYIAGEGRNTFIVSSENWGNFSLIIHQNSIRGHFLEVSCNMESELFILCYIKTCWWHCSLNDLPHMPSFLTSHFGRLEDIGSLGYAGLSTLAYYLIQYQKKITFITIINDLIRESLSWGKLSRGTVLDTSFFLILL